MAAEAPSDGVSGADGRSADAEDPVDVQAPAAGRGGVCEGPNARGARCRCQGRLGSRVLPCRQEEAVLVDPLPQSGRVSVALLFFVQNVRIWVCVWGGEDVGVDVEIDR